MTIKRRDLLKMGAIGGAAMAVPSAASAATTKPDDADKAFPAWTDTPYIHYSGHVSLYSAKTRSYMIKKGIHFTEATPFAAGDRWKNVIMKERKFFSIPVLELPDGAFLGDTT